MIGPPSRLIACEAIWPKPTLWPLDAFESDEATRTDFQILDRAFHDLGRLTKDLVADFDRGGEHDPPGHIGDATCRRLPIPGRAVTVGRSKRDSVRRQHQSIGANLREHRIRSLADVDHASIDRDRSVRPQVDVASSRQQSGNVAEGRIANAAPPL